MIHEAQCIFLGNDLVDSVSLSIRVVYICMVSMKCCVSDEVCRKEPNSGLYE